MPWTDPSDAIGVDKPIRASTHLALFQNFAAIANGEAGAPRIKVPEAIGAAATQTNLVLQPDGAGGVRWGSMSAGLVSGQRASHDGGEPNTTLPDGYLSYIYFGQIRNTAYHRLILPNPSANNIGNQFAVRIIQTGTYGATHIRVGHAGGAYLAQINDGDRYSAIFISDGAQWVPFAVDHFEPDDDFGD